VLVHTSTMTCSEVTLLTNPWAIRPSFASSYAVMTARSDWTRVRLFVRKTSLSSALTRSTCEPRNSESECPENGCAALKSGVYSAFEGRSGLEL
jgi:hypothetical protein